MSAWLLFDCVTAGWILTFPGVPVGFLEVLPQWLLIRVLLLRNNHGSLMTKPANLQYGYRKKSTQYSKTIKVRRPKAAEGSLIARDLEIPGPSYNCHLFSKGHGRMHLD